MTPEPPSNAPADPPEFFRRALVAGLIAWLVMTAVLLVGESSRVVALIAVAVPNALIAVASLAPGMALPSKRRWKRSADRAMAFMLGGVAAMAIRTVCTVALVAVCRYQMGAEAERVTLWIGFFYVVLTAVEVTVLARGGRTLDSATFVNRNTQSA
ncbi:MAG: hypothetical protein AAF958_10775 [Planctomycetota bacterium]